VYEVPTTPAPDIPERNARFEPGQFWQVAPQKKVQ
jgi:hypothetical protein